MKNLSAILLGSCLLCAHTAVAQDTTTASGSEFKASASAIKERRATAKGQAGATNAESKPAVDAVADEPAKESSGRTPAAGGGGFGGGSAGFGGGGGGFGFGGGGGRGGFGKAQLSGPAARMVSAENIMITWSKDNDQLRGFSLANGKWTLLPIPAQKGIMPIVGNSVAAVKLKKGIAAYSADTQRWAILTLPETSKAFPSLSDSLVTVYDSDHIYTFAASNGRWTSPTDKALEETKETIRAGNFTYNQQLLDEAVEGLSVIVSSSRGSLTVRGAERDVDEFKKRLAQLKPSGQFPRPSSNRRLPQQPDFSGPGVSQSRPATLAPSRSSSASSTNSISSQITNMAPSKSSQPPVSSWVQPQPSRSPENILNPLTAIPQLAPQPFHPSDSQSFSRLSGLNTFPVPAESPNVIGIPGAPIVPANRFTYEHPVGMRFTDSFFSRPSSSKTETASLNFAKKLRRKQDDQPLTKADKSELEKLVSAALEERLKGQQKSVDDLRKKLKAVEQKLKAKTDNKDKMIDRRVDELLNPELDWNSVSNKAARPAMARSFFDATSDKKSTLNQPTTSRTSPFDRLPTSTASDTYNSLRSFANPRSFGSTSRTTSQGETTRLTSQIPNQQDGTANAILPALQSAHAASEKSAQHSQSIAVQQTQLETQIADLKRQLNRNSLPDIDRERIEQDLAASSTIADATASKMKSKKAEVSKSKKNWTYAWEQFQAAKKLQESRVKVAEEIVQNETTETKRMQVMIERGLMTAQEGRSAEIQLKLAQLQLQSQQETLAQFERILKREPELDPSYSKTEVNSADEDDRS
ncbi:MAG: hypothetical protein ABJZ55_20935 [Fuerstiella sp.]